MDIEKVGLVKLPEAGQLQVATRLFSEPSTMEDAKIIIQEMRVNKELSPDIALIDASTNTPVQLYEGDSDVTEVFYSTTNNKPVGVILMSPKGEVSMQVYNPKTDGGQRGYSINKGWTMQTIIPEGTTLRFFDYWSPRGFATKEGEKMYGETVLSVVSNEQVLQKFRNAEKQLQEYMKTF